MPVMVFRPAVKAKASSHKAPPPYIRQNAGVSAPVNPSRPLGPDGRDLYLPGTRNSDTLRADRIRSWLQEHEPLAWLAHQRVPDTGRVNEWLDAVGFLLEVQTHHIAGEAGDPDHAPMSASYLQAIGRARNCIRIWSEQIVELALFHIDDGPALPNLDDPRPSSPKAAAVRPPKASRPSSPKAKSKAGPEDRGADLEDNSSREGDMPDRELNWQEYEPDPTPVDPSEPWYSRLSVRQIMAAEADFEERFARATAKQSAPKAPVVPKLNLGSITSSPAPSNEVVLVSVVKHAPPPEPPPGYSTVTRRNENGTFSYIAVKDGPPAKVSEAKAVVERPSRWAGRTPPAEPKSTLPHVRPPPPKIPAEFAKHTVRIRPRGPTAPPSTSSSGMRHQSEQVPAKRPETAYSPLPSGPRGGPPPPPPPGSADLGTRVRGTPGGGSPGCTGSLAATISKAKSEQQRTASERLAGAGFVLLKVPSKAPPAYSWMQGAPKVQEKAPPSSNSVSDCPKASVKTPPPCMWTPEEQAKTYPVRPPPIITPGKAWPPHIAKPPVLEKAPPPPLDLPEEVQEKAPPPPPPDDAALPLVVPVKVPPPVAPDAPTPRWPGPGDSPLSVTQQKRARRAQREERRRYRESRRAPRFATVPEEQEEDSDQVGDTDVLVPVGEVEDYRNSFQSCIFEALGRVHGCPPNTFSGISEPQLGPPPPSGDEVVYLSDANRGKGEWVRFGHFTEDGENWDIEEVAVTPVPRSPIPIPREWPTSVRIRAESQGSRMPQDPPMQGRWQNGPPPLFRVLLNPTESPAWEDHCSTVLDCDEVGEIQQLWPGVNATVRIPLSPSHSAIDSPREVFPIGVPRALAGDKLWWWCYNRAFFFYCPDCPHGLNVEGVWKVMLGMSGNHPDVARNQRRFLERCSVDLANWLSARIVISRHQLQSGAAGIGDWRVKQVVEDYELGRASPLYSVRGYRPPPYAKHGGVRGKPFGANTSWDGSAIRRPFKPFSIADSFRRPQELSR